MEIVLTDYFAAKLPLQISDLAPAAGPLNGAKLGLFRGNPSLNPSMSVSDLTASGVLPTYTGYATKTITWGAAAYRLTDGTFGTHGTIATPFAPTDAVTPNTITGFYVEDTGAANVFFAAFFDSPKSMLDALSFIDMDLFFSPQKAYGEYTVSP